MTGIVVRKAGDSLPAKTGFYEYRQNNSGGDFVVEHEDGISCHVIVEAYNADDADIRAANIGLYFGGYGDCPCCGDRWYSASEYDRAEVPSIYGTPVEEHYSVRSKWGAWTDADEFDCYVHYLDGRVVGYQYPAKAEQDGC